MGTGGARRRAVDASASASISCVKQQTARPKTLPARSLPSTKSRMDSEGDDGAPEVPDGEAVDASAKASISCVKQQTARPETLPARSLPSTKSRMRSKGDDGRTGGAGFVGINYVSRSAEQVALRSSSHNVRSTAPYHRGAVFSCKLGRYLLRALRRRIIAL